MKALVVFAIAALASIHLFAAERKTRLTPEQIEKRKAEYFGGHIVQPIKTKSIAIVDETKQVSHDVLEGVAADMKRSLGYDFSVGASDDSAVLLKIVNCNNLGTLNVMPDDGVVMVNVQMLTSDQPSETVLNRRLTKELWRGLVYVLGGGNSLFSKCVMKPVSNLKELDEIPAIAASPEVFPRMRDGAANRGIKTPRRVSYRQACREGWAPAPTNDVQKAIFEQIKAEKEKGPTNPLKIVPPNAKK